MKRRVWILEGTPRTDPRAFPDHWGRFGNAFGTEYMARERHKGYLAIGHWNNFVFRIRNRDTGETIEL